MTTGRNPAENAAIKRNQAKLRKTVVQYHRNKDGIPLTKHILSWNFEDTQFQNGNLVLSKIWRPDNPNVSKTSTTTLLINKIQINKSTTTTTIKPTNNSLTDTNSNTSSGFNSLNSSDEIQNQINFMDYLNASDLEREKCLSTTPIDEDNLNLLLLNNNEIEFSQHLTPNISAHNSSSSCSSVSTINNSTYTTLLPDQMSNQIYNNNLNMNNSNMNTSTNITYTSHSVHISEQSNSFTSLNYHSNYRSTTSQPGANLSNQINHNHLINSHQFANNQHCCTNNNLVHPQQSPNFNL